MQLDFRWCFEKVEFATEFGQWFGPVLFEVHVHEETRLPSASHYPRQCQMEILGRVLRSESKWTEEGSEDTHGQTVLNALEPLDGDLA